MINETNIACFLSVAETNNFTESAKRLFLTQQAVSKNVMQLEMDVGLNLIDRSTRNISLTPEGEKFRQVLLDISSYYHNELNMIKMFLNSHEKNIDFACQNFIDFGAGIRKAIFRAKEKDPELSVRINRYPPGELLVRLNDGSSNLILTYERYAPSGAGYKTQTLFSTHTSILVARDNPLVEENSTYLDFLNEPYIMDTFPGERENDIRHRAKRECAAAGIEPTEYIYVPNRESAYSTAALGAGILLGTDLSQIPPGYDIMRYRMDVVENVCCIYKTGATAAVECMVDSLREAYETAE